MRTQEATWFGAVNICREFSRRAARSLRVVWPEALVTPLSSNAQELVLQAMSSEVNLIMSRQGQASAAPSPHQHKLRLSLENSLAWLDARWPEVTATLPSQRDLSYLEVAAYCLLTHLDFRELVQTSRYLTLAEFARRFGERASVRETAYRFD
ncbi:MAG: glutathione S-transferase domain-containing protein [Polyangiaceae bacterium]